MAEGTVAMDKESNGFSDLINTLLGIIPPIVISTYTVLDTGFRSITPPTTSLVYLWFGVFFALLLFAFCEGYFAAGNPPISRVDFQRIVSAVKPGDTSRSEKILFDDIKEEWNKNARRGKQGTIKALAFFGYVAAIGGPFAYLSYISGFSWVGFYGTVIAVFSMLGIYAISNWWK
jgi:hypothetical protein